MSPRERELQPGTDQNRGDAVTKLSPDAVPAIRAEGISKSFYGVPANDHIDFDLRWGEVHALLGENGAGKSTLCSVLSGLYRPDSGEIAVGGEPVVFKSPSDALASGIGMVYQHFRLVERFTVAENLVLGHPDTPLRLPRSQVEAGIGNFIDEVGLPVSASARTWQLSVGEQQRVEILRLLYRGVQVLILDEPTAVLTPQEAQLLIQKVRELAEDGRAIIFVSHKLDEVLQVSDRVSVLVDGRKAGELRTSEANAGRLARMMVGRDFVPGGFMREESGPPAEITEAVDPVLSLTDLTVVGDRGREVVKGVGIDVYGGQIVGIAGVAGNGQRELAEAIAGLRPATGGSVLIGGETVTDKSPLDRIRAGFGFIPEDRLAMGLASGLSVRDNLVLKAYRRSPISRGPLLSDKAIKRTAARLVEEYDIRGGRDELPIRLLSGGNLQRSILAREISEKPGVLLAASPTRGLDLAATDSVRRLLLDAARRGLGVLLISEDLDEIRALADKILVMFRGEIVGEVEAGEFDPETIGMMMSGAGKALTPRV